jgi:hypothetical protein
VQSTPILPLFPDAGESRRLPRKRRAKRKAGEVDQIERERQRLNEAIKKARLEIEKNKRICAWHEGVARQNDALLAIRKQLREELKQLKQECLDRIDEEDRLREWTQGAPSGTPATRGNPQAAKSSVPIEESRRRHGQVRRAGERD